MGHLIKVKHTHVCLARLVLLEWRQDSFELGALKKTKGVCLQRYEWVTVAQKKANGVRKDVAWARHL